MPRPAKVRTISWTVSPKSTLVLREILSIAVNSFRADKVRATMTALGMVIGTFSLVLVVTIALTGKQYVLNEIQNIGANLIWAEYAGPANGGANTEHGRLSDRGRHDCGGTAGTRRASRFACGQSACSDTGRQWPAT